MTQRRALILYTALGLFLLLSTLFGVGTYYYQLLLSSPVLGNRSPLPDQNDAALPVAQQAVTPLTLIIPKGASLSKIASLISIVSLNRLSPLEIKLLVLIRGNAQNLKAGEYVINQDDTVENLLDRLKAGDVYLHRITIPEGLTDTDIYNLLQNDTRLIQDVDFKIYQHKGLLPETYFFARGERVSSILKRMETAFMAVISDLWRKRPSEFSLQNKREVTILASIIEKETGKTSERSLVSAVFHNRLAKGMRLQSDPTVVYAVSGNKGLKRSLTKSDLATESPYNTYRVSGLPPTPIANPGKASLEAAIFPASAPYIYFVADGVGGHKFAVSLLEHNKNVRDYRAKLKSTKSKMMENKF